MSSRYFGIEFDLGDVDLSDAQLQALDYAHGVFPVSKIDGLRDLCINVRARQKVDKNSLVFEENICPMRG